MVVVLNMGKILAFSLYLIPCVLVNNGLKVRYCSAFPAAKVELLSGLS